MASGGSDTPRGRRGTNVAGVDQRPEIIHDGVSAETASSALATGEPVGPAEFSREPSEFAADGWPLERTIEASAVAQLLRGQAGLAAHPTGLYLRGLRIRGRLDLSRTVIVPDVTLEGCLLDESVLLSEASGNSIVIINCRIAGVEADGMKLARNLFLLESLCDGSVSLTGAMIGGQLDLAGTRITAGADQEGLTAYLISIQHGLFMTDGFSCTGQVNFANSRIGDFVSLTSASIEASRHPALSFEDARIDGRVAILDGSVVRGGVGLTEAKIGYFDVIGSRIEGGDEAPGLDADSLKCDGPIRIGPDATLLGSVTLDDATAASMTLEGSVTARVDGGPSPDIALSVRRFNVAGTVRSPGSLRIAGSVDASGLHVGGDLDLSSLTIETDAPGGEISLDLDGATIEGAVHLDGDFSTTSTVEMFGASVGRDLTLGGQWAVEDASALACRRLRVGDSLILRPDLSIPANVMIADSSIGGDLLISGAIGGADGSIAIDLSRTYVRGSIRPHTDATEPMRVRGTVQMEGLRCDGDARFGTVICGGASDDEDGSSPPGQALDLTEARIGGSLYFNNRFRAIGEVRLFRAEISGSAVGRGCTIRAPGGKAISAEGLRATHLLLDGADVVGRMILVDADLRGINLTDSRLQGDLICVRMSVAGPAYLTFALLEGKANFDYAESRLLRAGPALLASRPRVNGFVYDAIEGASYKEILEMLPRGPRFAPQPYERLAQVLRQAGEPIASRNVLIAMRKIQLGSRRDHPLTRAWSAVVGRTVAFGYRPERAVFWLIAAGILGALLCAGAWPEHFTPARDDVPAFNPLIYSFDSLLPIIDFKQQDAWIPHSYMRVWTWLVILTGWILSTALVAGITRAMSRV